ncbi:Hypothetical predicted protein [Pelobates cultripes]|uniref:Uncharacterized protein n=1 Tax=Pelobates cultripes TaxID=61616 RepID=A0AAD1WRI8_PELCU|nr:Hypothetical predicted protein [Pelobates cultripes]
MALPALLLPPSPHPTPSDSFRLHRSQRWLHVHFPDRHNLSNFWVLRKACDVVMVCRAAITYTPLVMDVQRCPPRPRL